MTVLELLISGRHNYLIVNIHLFYLKMIKCILNTFLIIANFCNCPSFNFFCLFFCFTFEGLSTNAIAPFWGLFFIIHYLFCWPLGNGFKKLENFSTIEMLLMPFSANLENVFIILFFSPMSFLDSPLCYVLSLFFFILC